MSEYDLRREEEAAWWAEKMAVADDGPAWEEQDSGQDDSEAYRWDYEQRCKDRGIYCAPTNWSYCYQSEIMCRRSDSGGAPW